MKSVTPDVLAVCNDGFTVGGKEGNPAKYEIHCGKKGLFDEISATCERVKFNVQGVVTDSTDAHKLRGVQVRFTLNGEEIASTTSNWAGVYNVDLPQGRVKVSSTLAGYIDGSFHVDVRRSMRAGGVADLAISPVLPPGEWRIQLTWAGTSRDLDSYTQFGNGVQVSYKRRRGQDRSSGIQAVLDLDDVDGWGPETTTLKGIGKCKIGRRCMVHFLVDNYTPWSRALGNSLGEVTILRGASTVASFQIPRSVGSSRSVHVFSLDATEGVERVYPGNRFPAPLLLASEAPVDWRTSFNMAAWSEVGEHKYVSGVDVASTSGGLNKIAFGRYVKVVHSSRDICQEVRWGLGDRGWSQCPPGQFLNGFHRTGRETDIMTSMSNINLAKCCRPAEIADPHWEHCVDVSAWSTCPKQNGRDTALTGMHRKTTVVWDEIMQEKIMGDGQYTCHRSSDVQRVPARSGEDCALLCAKKADCRIAVWEETEGVCEQLKTCVEVQRHGSFRTFMRIRREPLSVIDKFRCCSLPADN